MQKNVSSVLMVGGMLALGIELTACAGEPKNGQQVLIGLEKELARAIVNNDADEIARFLADDWCIIHTNGSIMSRASFLGFVKSGEVTHDTMEGSNWRVKIYGDAAVVTAEARSGGKHKGKAFRTHERATSVYAKIDGRWLCVLTQLTSLK